MPGSLSFRVYLKILLKNINEVRVLCSVFDTFKWHLMKSQTCDQKFGLCADKEKEINPGGYSFLRDGILMKKWRHCIVI